MTANTSSTFFVRSFSACLCLFLLAQITPSSALSQDESRKNTPKTSVSDRIKPIGEVYISDAPTIVQQPIDTNVDISPGEKIATAACLRCHSAGLMKSPKIGNHKDWAPRLKKGRETLYDHAINGHNKMPARGGKRNLSDNDIKAAVDHMLVGVK